MERWVLEGDNYSFLRSAPHTFNLQSREGPNRVEIFDITSIPSHRNAISETTCLCDIFGDDAESPSLSSSPASATFVRREVDQLFSADDANDSSGSYHTASGSDLSENAEVTYNTPSPKNVEDFSPSEKRDSGSPFSSDSKNGLNPLDCTPSVPKVNSNDLSHTDNWEEPQVSASIAPVNDMEITNASELQDKKSTLANSFVDTKTEPSVSSFCSSNQKEPVDFEEEGNITTPEHTSTFDKQDCIPIFESTDCESLAESQLEQNNVVSFESKESMNYHSQPEENNVFAELTVNSGSASEFSNTSLTNCSPIQEMSVSPAKQDINFTPEPRLPSTSPVDRRMSSTPASTGISSPELISLCSEQLGSTSESRPTVSSLPISDDVDADLQTVSSISTVTGGHMCSSIDRRESVESPEINETCSSPDQPVPAHSPEQVMIHSPLVYTISPSPSPNERVVSSTEPEASLSSPVVTRTDYSDICSSPDYSEPVIIHPSPGYTSSPSPSTERGVYSTEPEASSYSCCHSDISSSFEHSVSAHSPEPVIIHLPMGYTMTPSPTDERMVSSAELDDLPSSPAITTTDYTGTCSRNSTPALRSITSTPNNYLTPEPTSPSPSLELRSVTCSPEIKTIAYSILPQNTKSPMTEGIAYNVSPNENLAPSPAVDTTVCSKSSETSNSCFENDALVSLSSRNFLSTPKSRSRSSSAASEDTRDRTLSPQLQPEPSIPYDKTDNQPLSIICEEKNSSSHYPIDNNKLDDPAGTDTLKSTASVPNKYTESGPEVLKPILKESPSKLSGSELSTVEMENNQETVTDNTIDLTVCGTPTSSPWASSVPLSVPSVEKNQCHVEIQKEVTEIMKKDSPNSNKRLSQVPVTLRESPGVISRDNGGEFDKAPCREKEESGKREGEREETKGDSSYRGEQVELSFSARNRKGSAGHSPALSSRDPKSGIPARCYFESPPTTLQQQSQLRAQGSQQENKGGARRLQSAALGKYSSAGVLPPECTGETSSMGSEFDEADNEVKWFTDLAFRSLSSPQVDYLDVYNSSHRSSTNVSQPSTIDSPGAVAWMTYADLRGSAVQENDGSSFLPRDGLDPNKRFEMGSFECVDVALECKEESSRGKRTVPKRQIQLLRRNTDETKHKGNNEDVSNSPSTTSRSRDTLFRQHSTPPFLQQEVSKEVPDSPQINRKKTMQKSVSLDDGSPKTQMASCIIKSVLSKKMQDAQKETTRSTDSCSSGDKNKHPDISPSSFDGMPSNMEKHSLSSSQHSECTFSSEDFAVEEERISHRQVKKCAPKVPPKPFLRPSFFNAQEAQASDSITREETKTIIGLPPVDDKTLVKQNNKSDGKEKHVGKLGEKYNSDSANATVRNTNRGFTSPAISRRTRKDTKCQMTPENQEHLAGNSVFMSKTPEITLKPSSVKGKKKSSLKVSLSPDLEQSREISESQSIEKATQNMSTKMSEDKDTEDDGKNKSKTVIHKVRDVRKLVKNTYNLSFKASNSTSTVEDTFIQEKREKPPQTPPALHIECKAISWKDKQTSDSKATHWHGEKQPVDISKISQPLLSAETRRDADITEITSIASSQEIEPQQKSPDSNSATIGGLPESENLIQTPNIHCDQSDMLPPRPPIKEREESALVVLPEGTSKSFEPTNPDSTQIKGSNTSHSVSMLLKEKGMQADIGVCDVLTEGVSARTKHVNRLEVPLQACSSEGISSESPVKAESTALPCNPAALVNNYSKILRQSDSPKGTIIEESSTKEQEKKKITSTPTMTQIPTFLATSDKPEVRSFSSSAKNNAMPVNASKEIELPIQVRSISTDRLKSFVPPKPSYKQSFAEMKSVPNDPLKADSQASSVIKQETRLGSESKKTETPSSMIQKDQPNEASSRDTKKLAVSAVSSCKPPPIPVTTAPSTVPKSTTMAMTSGDQQQSSAFFQATSTCLKQTPSFNQDQAALDSSFSTKPSGPQAVGRTQSATRASSNNRFHTDDYLFYASDDPPSYDERESFSPLRLSDLPSQRSCRYHPSTNQSPCSCLPSSQSLQGHPHHSPPERVPAASRSPGQVLNCPGAPPQAQVRPHQCRPDGLPVSSSSIPHASALIQPLHNPRACPVSNSQSYGDDQPANSGLHVDRRPANHPSPQAAAPAPYHEYSHSANMTAQLFNPQDLPPSFGHDYTNEGPGGAGVLYQENASGLSCGQGPRRVLLDPETGKYFYIEVPMQPLRKMLFDPELGQYVEVLIPQQTMSHPGLYPPAAPPYSSLHSPGLYAPQYLPYAVPSYPAIPGSAQQVRHPEPPPVPTSLHQSSLRYGSPAGQMPKNEPKGHSSLDQSYLESMYYIPTGMNASPNSTPSDCYHKPSSSMPSSGGRRA